MTRRLSRGWLITAALATALSLVVWISIDRAGEGTDSVVSTPSPASPSVERATASGAPASEPPESTAVEAAREDVGAASGFGSTVRDATEAPKPPAAEGTRSDMASARPAAAGVPSEAQLTQNDAELLPNEAFAVLSADPIEPFLLRLGGDASAVATALAFEYRNGVSATLPARAEVRHMACGNRLCVVEAWFPDRELAVSWSETAFGRGGLPAGHVQVAVIIPIESGWRYRAMFSVDPRIRSIVRPIQRPPAG